jgi:hypothetical protein
MHRNNSGPFAVPQSLLAKADTRAKDLQPILTEMWKGGSESYGLIAKQLTDPGISIARGKTEWSAMQVKRFVDRLAS